ncbi:UTRA domain-containing protein [Streptomyces boncukensis]|uniref:GntR family transcriptional regulator n=1 Tax=Streptomyces boncukensis TaxID=2711219 RepID=A0A6G4X0K2_9ACTN|nr:GntR family transcriptional regulator [Streptomyces boncukensis]
MAKVYEQIAADLRESIRAGERRPGDQLPAESALEKTYKRSGPTIRHALSLLEAEGLIEKIHGRGSFVRSPRIPVLRSNERHQWEKSRARESTPQRAKTGSTEHDTGLTVNDLVFSARYREIKANEDLAGALGVPEGTPLLERTYRTRYAAEDYPFNVSVSHIPVSLIEPNPDLLDEGREPWPGGTFNQLLTVGIEVARVDELVTARPPTVEEAEELGLPPGTSVLTVRKTCVDTDDRVVDIADVLLPGDRTKLQFTTPLERW